MKGKRGLQKFTTISHHDLSIEKTITSKIKAGSLAICHRESRAKSRKKGKKNVGRTKQTTWPEKEGGEWRRST
jgi:ketosteroid isomerase-like protein